MDKNVADGIELGAWLGRGQAFGLIANMSQAAQAECLRRIHDTEAYKVLEVTWEDFCRDYTGLTRRRVEEIIANLEEFGKTYFRLAEIVRISPETYRQIAEKVVEGSIEIGGELVPIAVENAARIRSAVSRMRSELKQARREAQLHCSPGISQLMSRVDSIYEEMARQAGQPLITKLEKAELRGLAAYTTERMARVTKLVKE